MLPALLYHAQHIHKGLPHSSGNPCLPDRSGHPDRRPVTAGWQSPHAAVIHPRRTTPEALSASAAFPPESPNPFDRIIICLFCPQSRRYRSPRRRSDRLCPRFLRLRSGQSLTHPERRPAADRAFRTAYRRTAQALRYLP